MPREAGKEETLRKAFWLIIPSVFFVDRLFKIWALDNLELAGSLRVIPDVFHLTLVHNTGAAFGLMRGGSAVLAVFSGISVLLIGYYLARAGAVAPHAAAWALVAGGALGNLYDRVMFGYVVDYLDFRIWPVFNLADAAISCGVAWILFGFLRRRGDSSHASGPF